MTWIHRYGPTLLLLATVLAVMLLGPITARRLALEHQDERVRLAREDLHQTPSLAELSDSFHNVAQVVAPSVVHIEVLGAPKNGRFHDFSDDVGIEEDDASQSREFNPPRSFANGSGWVYDELGHIVTNNHVIRDADQIIVRFVDGREVRAQVIGTDDRTDVAVLRVPHDHLRPAQRAEREITQGEIVFAFGSPFKFDFSMSQGIVSATNRRNLGILGPGGYEDFIQTDAAINPGNSGGPLTNIYGQVVGMNTAIAAAGGRGAHDASFSGLGFAIPVKMVSFVVDQLIAQGQVHRGYLGVFISELSPAMSQTFGFIGQGVLVDWPGEDSRAYHAGLRRGDIITQINGQSVASVAELRSVVSQQPPESTLSMRVFSERQMKTIIAVLSELPEDPGVTIKRVPLTDAPMIESPDLLKQLGVESVSVFTPELARRAGMVYQPGVIARRVRIGSLAGTADRLAQSRQVGPLPARPRIPPETIITHVMGKPVGDLDELVNELAGYDLTRGVRIGVLDGGLPRYVLLLISE